MFWFHRGSFLAPVPSRFCLTFSYLGSLPSPQAFSELWQWLEGKDVVTVWLGSSGSSKQVLRKLQARVQNWGVKMPCDPIQVSNPHRVRILSFFKGRQRVLKGRQQGLRKSTNIYWVLFPFSPHGIPEEQMRAEAFRKTRMWMQTCAHIIYTVNSRWA